MDITQSKQNCIDTISTNVDDSMGNTIAQISAAGRDGLGLLILWRQRVNQRRALARLDDKMLQDIGIDKANAMLEIVKPFWRA